MQDKIWTSLDRTSTATDAKERPENKELVMEYIETVLDGVGRAKCMRGSIAALVRLGTHRTWNNDVHMSAILGAMER
jgi:hypothetical protein